MMMRAAVCTVWAGVGWTAAYAAGGRPAATTSTPAVGTPAPLAAFPGAEGFGATAQGGRGGRVIKVTNLNPTGPGSLQAACEAKGPRIVVFEVSGVIQAPRYGRTRAILIKEPNITIAGQTAPGAGITIDGMLQNPYRLQPNLHDVVIRFLRVRPSPVPGTWEGGDCLQLTDIDRLILDHVSCSWGSDENADLCNSREFTVQWCAIEESDTKGHAEGQHNFGMIMGYAGRNATLHHTLFAHHKDRAPLSGLEILDHRNNVIYNMRLHLSLHPTRMNAQRPNEPFRVNLVGNYYKDGPDAPMKASAARGTPLVVWKRPWANLFARGNYMTWLGRVEDNLGEGPAPEKPWPAPPVATQSAEEAYRLVLAHAGCLPRDAVGRRTVEEVRTGTGSWGRHDPAGGLMEGLKPASAPADTDNDGMPDDWERANGLDPRDPADAARVVPAGASKDDRHRGYTYIEFYVNDLADRLVDEALRRAPIH